MSIFAVIFLYFVPGLGWAKLLPPLPRPRDDRPPAIAGPGVAVSLSLSFFGDMDAEAEADGAAYGEVGSFSSTAGGASAGQGTCQR
jgi:hypothetical protein